MADKAARRELRRAGVAALLPRFPPIEPYLWVLPALILLAVFVLAPLIFGLYLSFQDWGGMGAMRFVGLGNYRDAFSDSTFWASVRNNAVYAVGTVTGKIVLSLALAVLLNQRLRGRSAYRVILFMPVVMSFIVIGLIWSWIYNYQFGLLNNLLGALNLASLKHDWLGDPGLALDALIAVDIWKWYGFHMIIYLAGLQAIPAELYEAARIDGASPWQSFRRITLPLLQPITMINVSLSLMGAFNVFDLVYVMTEGGPANVTNVALLHIYVQAFQFYKFGYASALSYVLFVLVAILSFLSIRLLATERYF
jgi:ABC-type sugar transport system permease subunit